MQAKELNWNCNASYLMKWHDNEFDPFKSRKKINFEKRLIFSNFIKNAIRLMCSTSMNKFKWFESFSFASMQAQFGDEYNAAEH